MIIRVLRTRVVVAALLTAGTVGMGIGSTGTIACASSISSSDTAATDSHAATSTTEISGTFELSDNGPALAGSSESQDALELVTGVGLTSTEPQMSLVLEESAETAALAKTTPAAPTFLTSAALPLNLSDVPEPTTFGLLLLGLAGLFVARRVARKV